jgi:predicted HTH transcriptional regulator
MNVDFFESQFIEFKDYGWPFNANLKFAIKKEICAFINSMGGLLMIGINDQSIVKGIRLNNREKEDFKEFLEMRLIYLLKIKRLKFGRQLIGLLLFPLFQMKNSTEYSICIQMKMTKTN